MSTIDTAIMNAELPPYAMRRIDKLTPSKNNARTHKPKQIKQIAASIREFGFTVPVLVDAESTILAGHARVEAAKQLGMDSVPVIQIDHLTVNRLAVGAETDPL